MGVGCAGTVQRASPSGQLRPAPAMLNIRCGGATPRTKGDPKCVNRRVDSISGAMVGELHGVVRARDKRGVPLPPRGARYPGGRTAMGDLIGSMFKAFDSGGIGMYPISVALIFAIAIVIERRTGYLAMISNVATLLGLLGTIIGLIHCFGAVANANPADKATILSQGISEAMYCTAFGLLVAITTLVLYSVLQGRTQTMVDDINESAVGVLNLIVANRDKMKMPAGVAMEEAVE